MTDYESGWLAARVELVTTRDDQPPALTGAATTRPWPGRRAGVSLVINECRVNSTGGAGYLMEFRRRMESMPGRVRILKASIGGDLFAVQCENRTHAKLLADALSMRGQVPRSAMKITGGSS